MQRCHIIRFCSAINVFKRYNFSTITSNDTQPKTVNDLTALVIARRDQLSLQSLFIDQLLEQIKLAKHHRFGVKSEHISPDQLRLLLDQEQKTIPYRVGIDDDVADQPETAARTKRTKRGRHRLPCC